MFYKILFYRRESSTLSDRSTAGSFARSSVSPVKQVAHLEQVAHSQLEQM